MKYTIKRSLILIISDDLKFVESLKEHINDKNEYSFFESNKFYLLNSDINNFDLIVFDDSKNDLKIGRAHV